ncbi:MAG: hypothetical protein GY906_13765 [bacterium]|nr:hypothetical protein [bacterium]
MQRSQHTNDLIAHSVALEAAGMTIRFANRCGEDPANSNAITSGARF